jgi:F0F1-type ATP synthase membrane subunit a
MEHPFTWYALLPNDWQAHLQQHTFFALVSSLFVLLFAWRGRAALARAQDPAVPGAELGTRNIAELLVGLVVSQSDAIIGRQGRKFVPYFGTFCLFYSVT